MSHHAPDPFSPLKGRLVRDIERELERRARHARWALIGVWVCFGLAIAAIATAWITTS